jgi:hypothetical protein
MYVKVSALLTMPHTSQPPVLALLTSRTRFYGGRLHHPSITTRTRFTPYPVRQDIPPADSDKLTAMPFPTAAQFSRDMPQTPTTNIIDKSNPTITPSVDSKPLVENDGLVPKPSGEVGRRGSRGYSLDQTLKWQEEDLAKLKV